MSATFLGRTWWKGLQRNRPQIKGLGNAHATAIEHPGAQVGRVASYDAVAFGVPFLANPDLPERFRLNAPLNPPDPSNFYAPGPKGYTDYPFVREAA